MKYLITIDLPDNEPYFAISRLSYILSKLSTHFLDDPNIKEFFLVDQNGNTCGDTRILTNED